MKSLLITLALIATSAQAAHLHSVVHDAETDELVFDLTYGGCALDTFKLEYGLCGETFPMRLRATLDDTKDICRAIIRTTLRLPLSTHCRPANMTIRSKQNGSSVTVYVPEG